MTRRKWLNFAVLPAAVMGACRSKQRPLNIFPETFAGGWRRTAFRELSASESPDPVPRMSVDRFQTAAYEGAGKLVVRLYQVSSPAVGLDLAQRWRPSSDTVFFNTGNYFVVINWQEADRKALQQFVRELQARLKPAA